MNILITLISSLVAAYAYMGINTYENQALFVTSVMIAGIFAIYGLLDADHERINREYDEQTKLND